MWKKLFIIVSGLLVISLILGGSLWHQLKVTKTQLANTTAQLKAIETQLDKAKDEGSWLVDHYPNFREQISRRLGRGPDTQSFVTPDDPTVSTKVQEITGGYAEDAKERWADYSRLYSWIIMNIEYARDSHTPVLPEPMSETLEWEEGFWRMPTETIRDRAGDCEDMVVLLVSMLLNYNEGRLPVWAVGIRTSGQKSEAHIALAFPVEGNKLTILDPAARYHTTFPCGFGIAAEDVSVAVNAWLSRWAEKMGNAHIHLAFSDKFYQEFSSTEEFIEWVKKQ